MSSYLHGFMFDENFGMATESVFTLVDYSSTPPLPPVEGYLLLTDETNFLLTDLENLALA